MSTSETQATETLAEGFTRTWRYKAGLSLIVGGHVILLIGIAFSGNECSDLGCRGYGR